MSNPSPSITRGKRTRTFTGCLTCRRRRVKCPDPTLPCQTCRRLQLECVSPFSSNLRSVTVTKRPMPPQRISKKGPVQTSETSRRGSESLAPSTSCFNPAPPQSADASSLAASPFDFRDSSKWNTSPERWDETDLHSLDPAAF